MTMAATLLRHRGRVRIAGQYEDGGQHEDGGAAGRWRDGRSTVAAMVPKDLKALKDLKASKEP